MGLTGLTLYDIQPDNDNQAGDYDVILTVTDDDFDNGGANVLSDSCEFTVTVNVCPEFVEPAMFTNGASFM